MPPERALDWLLPRRRVPLLTMSAAAPGAEACRREGLLTELWPGLLVACDRGTGPSERLAAVAPYLPDGAVLARQSAVWVHTGRYRPHRLDVILSGSRHRSTALVHVHVEELAEPEVVDLQAGRVTSPARTAVDVARRASARDAVLWLSALHATTALPPSEIASALKRAVGRAGVGRARDLLRPLTESVGRGASRHGPAEPA